MREPQNENLYELLCERRAGTIIATAKRSLAAYKVPKRVEFIDKLPRNSMGKVQKSVLRERFAS